MKHSIRKNNPTIIIITITAGCLFLLSIVWGVFCVVRNVCEESFWYINLEGIVTIFLDILVGVLIAFVILLVGEKNENNRRKKELIHEILDQIESYFTDKLPILTSTDLKSFWSISLSSKKITQQLINNLKKLSFSDTLSNTFQLLSHKHKEYFDYIDNCCFPNAKLTDEIITSEKTLREEMIIAIKSTICDIYV